MKIRYTIAWRIGTGFAVLIMLTILVFYVTNNTLNESKRISDDINEIYNPSVYQLEVLKLHLLRSNTMMTEWVQHQSSEDVPLKIQYIELVEEDLPATQEKIRSLYTKWIDHERHLAEKIFGKIDTMLAIHQEIRNNLVTWEDYADFEAKFLSDFALEEAQAQMEGINIILQDLIIRERNNSIRVSADMVESFDLLQFLVRNLSIALVIMGIFISIYTARSIVKPVNYAKSIVLDLSKGIIERRKIKSRNDEIGEMTKAMNKLIEGMNMTKDFANALGQGNYEFPYTLLSPQDELGKDLLKMRVDLAENERILEEKVRLRTAEVVQKKEEIEEQSKEISHLYHEVTDSIVYAKRIQEAVFQPLNEVRKILPNAFLYFKPKDIVSGDFYWVEEKDGLSYFAASDCTGHGVPGAFMSIIGHNGLNQAMNFCNTPAEMLDALNESLSKSLHQDTGETETKDGMDIALCSLDRKKNILHYAGAFNPLYLVRNGELIITKADKFPVGSFIDEEKNSFTNHEVQLEKEDSIFICSDGLQNQFGGPKGKKFMLGRLKRLFVDISAFSVEEQIAALDKAFEEWRGDEEQVDDILVIGLKVS
ncbi:MAG: SpoIIE family protein phosphatase [Vicingaceae bacterium]